MHSDYYQTLIYKHLTGELSDKEQKDLEAWLFESPANRRQLEEAERIWTLTATATANPEMDIDLDHEISRFKQRINFRPPQATIRPRTSLTLLRYAAAATVLLGGVILLLRFGIFGGTEMIRFKTVANEMREVTLPDQSKVWLNENSRLTYNEGFKTRSVELTGEAFFDVTHDADNPFEIKSGKGLIQVLGTSFSVRNRTEEDEIRVTVATGIVALSLAGTSTREALEAGYQGKLGKTDHTMSKTPNNNPAFLAWRNQPLVFDNTPMSSVVETLRSHFAIVIESPDATLASCTYTGEFDEPVLGEIIQSLAFSLNITASVEQGVYAFTGIGCSE